MEAEEQRPSISKQESEAKSLQDACLEFLVGSELYDALPSFDQFQQLIPKSHRDSPEVKKLYRKLQKKRELIRKEVTSNIKQHYAEEQAISHKRPRDSIDECIAYLEEKERILEEELQIEEAELAKAKKILSKFEQDIDVIHHKVAKKASISSTELTPKHIESVISML